MAILITPVINEFLYAM